MAEAEEVKQEAAPDELSNLSGVKKAAVFVITIGSKSASEMMKSLKDEEVEDIMLEIAGMKNVKPEVVDGVLKEFYRMMEAKRYILEGGYDYAHELISQLGSGKNTEKMLKKLKAKTGNSVFDEFQESKIQQIAGFIENEHPQVAALIFSQLKVGKSAEILSHLNEEKQVEIIYRLASMDQISPDVIDEIEEVIKEQMGGIDSIGDRVKSGTATVAEILNGADMSVEAKVLESIELRDPQMAEAIKEQMFLFEDIVHLDDKTIQVIINEMEKADLVMGLKGVDDAISARFLDNMSNRAADMLREDMEALGPVALKDVNDAQQRIIVKIKKLEDEGLISTKKMEAEDIVE